MKPLFEMPLLTDLDGIVYNGGRDIIDPGKDDCQKGCSAGCRGGCNPGGGADA